MSDQERDASMERLLREAMAGDHRPPASECLDPETLAAWMDGTLISSERSFVEAHAARCPRCQAMLATMVRTVPDPIPASPWTVRRWLMLAGPALATAAAVALWFAVGPRQVQHPEIPSAQSARRDAAETPPRPPESVTSPASAPTADRPFALADKETQREQKRSNAAPAADVGREAAAEMVDARRQVAKDSADRFANAAASRKPSISEPSAVAAPVQTPQIAQAKPEDPSADERRRFRATVPTPAGTPPPPPPPPAMPVQQTVGQSQAAQGQQAAQAPPRPDQVQQIDRVGAADRTAGFMSGAGGGARAEESRSARGALNESVLVRMAPANVDVTVPGSSVRWRILGGRTIQHSTDNGTTWAMQYAADEQTALLAGAAPTPTTAWLVGRSGVVLVTTDGRTWRRVSFPEAVDLTSVTALDASVAAVTTADKRTFTTADGGTSWRRQ